MQQPFYASPEINRQGDFRNNKELIKKIEKAFEYKCSNTESFLYIKNLVNQNLLDKETLSKCETFETYASGDVLIR